jgi:RNA polymerase sigma-70 factor (sigma-E family)
MAHQRTSAGEIDREFDSFVASASPSLLRTAYLLTGDRADAEDLLQNALLRVFRRWEAIEGPPVAYTFTVLANLSRDRQRWLKRRPVLSNDDERAMADTADPVEQLLNRAEIVQAARRLPRVQQSVIACRFLLDLSVHETAVALGLAEGTVMSHTARALTKLRGLLMSESANALEVGNAK